MSEALIKPRSLRDLVAQPSIKEKLGEIMGPRGQQFAVALVNICQQSWQLQKCTPGSVLGAAFQAAALDLSVDPNIGEAHLVPYGETCTLQIGYLGMSQLAMRSGQYKNLGWCVVHADELVTWDELSGELVVDQTRKESEKIVGYAAKFKLLNGFERGHYLTVEQVTDHAKRFSKSYAYGLKNPQKQDSPWFTNFDRMALKTVLKMLLKLWGPKSVQMQKALVVDEGAVIDTEGSQVVYPDGQEPADAGLVKPEFDKPAEPPAPEPAAPPAQLEPKKALKKTPLKAPDAPKATPKGLKEPEEDDEREKGVDFGKMPATNGSPANPAYNVLKAVRGLCNVAGVTQEQVISFLQQMGSIDEDVTSLEELAMSEPNVLAMLHQQFADIASRIKGGSK